MGVAPVDSHQSLPEYVRHDMRAKAYASLSAQSVALLVLTKLVLLFLPVPEIADTGFRPWVGTTTAAPIVDTPETESSRILRRVCNILLLIPLLLPVVVEVLNYDEWGSTFMFFLCNSFLLLYLLPVHTQLLILLPELLLILSATLILATGISLALSARCRARSQESVPDLVDQGQWIGAIWMGRGVVLAGVKVAGRAPSTLPSLPLLLAWLAAAWLGSSCLGIHGHSVIASFALVWLFLIDADGPLQIGDPDDHRLAVVLMQSKVAFLLVTTALQQLFIIIAGPSDFLTWSQKVVWFLLFVNPFVRFFLLVVWPGPRPVEAERIGRRAWERFAQMRREEETARLRRQAEEPGADAAERIAAAEQEESPV